MIRTANDTRCPTPTLPHQIRRVRSVVEILILGSACCFGLIFLGRSTPHVPDQVAPVAFARTGDVTIWTVEAEKLTGIKARDITWKPLWFFAAPGYRTEMRQRWNKESDRSYQTVQAFDIEHQGRAFRLTVCMGGDVMALGVVRRR